MGAIVYQNKDIAAKVTAESLVGSNLSAFGLPDIKVMGLLPTNLPVIESNEMRLDQLFLLNDGSIGIIDYESAFTKENFVKYMNYVARVIKRYADKKQLDQLTQIKILVIYTADVDWAQEIYDLGDVILRIEAAYLVRQDTDAIYLALNQKIRSGAVLTAEELAQLMILPLTVKGIAGKQAYIQKAIGLAKQLPGPNLIAKAVAGILTFTDKVIDPEYAKKLKEELQMTLVEKLIFEDGWNKGIEQGTRALIRVCQDLHIAKPDVLQKIMNEFDMSQEESETYLEKYWQ